MTTVLRSPEVAHSKSMFDAERLISLDALRGFDMLLIVGLGDIVRALTFVNEGAIVQFLTNQFKHKKWEGLAFHDLIFPLFVFMVGVSLVFSLDRSLEQGGARSATVRLSRRVILLFFLGVFFNGGIANGSSNIRWMGVLQRIALSYFFGALVYLGCGRGAKRVAGVTVLILVAYWAVMSFVPVPGGRGEPFTEYNNLASYIDQQLLPGKPYYETGWDPEGILSTLPAIGTCLIGVLTGLLLKNANLTPQKKVAWMIVAGATLIGLGLLWGLNFPIIKRLWTSSFVLVAGGYSLLLLGVSYLFIDLWGFRRGISPLVWFGSNALTMYLLSVIVDFPRIANRLVGGEIKGWFGVWGETFIAMASLGLSVAVAGFMYRRRIFIRM